MLYIVSSLGNVPLSKTILCCFSLMSEINFLIERFIKLYFRTSKPSKCRQ